MSLLSSLFFILPFLGFVNSLFLLSESAGQLPLCQAGSCASVLGSAYAYVGALPLSILGVGFYLVLIYLGILWFKHRSQDVSFLIFCVSGFGGIVSLVLIGLQAFVIHAWCLYCLFSAFIVGVIFSLSIWLNRSGFKEMFHAPFSRIRPYLWPIIALFLIPVFIYAALFSQHRSSGVSDPVVAQMGSVSYRLSDVDARIPNVVSRANRQLYVSRLYVLEKDLLEKEAAALNKLPQDLFNQEVNAKVQVSNADVDAYILAHVASDLAQVPNEKKQEIYAYLRQAQYESLKDAFFNRLKEKYNAVFLLPQNLAHLNLDPNPRGGPEKGPKNAKYTIIEFSDLQCGHCAQAHYRLKAMMKEHPKDIRVIFRHYPLNSIHAQAQDAALASACAHRQGKFWEYVDYVYTHQYELNTSNYMKWAQLSGLNMAAFKTCYDTQAALNDVMADVNEGQQLGLNGTPSFVVNGQLQFELPSL